MTGSDPTSSGLRRLRRDSSRQSSRRTCRSVTYSTTCSATASSGAPSSLRVAQAYRKPIIYRAVLRGRRSHTRLAAHRLWHRRALGGALQHQAGRIQARDCRAHKPLSRRSLHSIAEGGALGKTRFRGRRTSWCRRGDRSLCLPKVALTRIDAGCSEAGDWSVGRVDAVDTGGR